jgi:type II secretory pathway pseudopilin PulG
MNRPFGGFTIVEVLIVTAISTFLFVSAIIVFSGKRQATEFSQAMQDLSSTIQNYANEVTTGTFPESSDLMCQVDTDGYAYFTAPDGSASHNCAFAGRAIAVRSSEPDKLSIYTIVADRSGSDFKDAQPVPARNEDADPPEDVFLDIYTLQSGTAVKSSTVDGGSYDLIGLFTNFNSTTPSTNDSHTSLVGKAYQLGDVRECISKNTCGVLDNFKKWTLCVTDGNRTAKLVLDTAPTGLTSQINFATC